MTAIAAFELKSPNTQTAAPFFIGHCFAKGDVPSGQNLHIDTPNYAVVPLKHWNDGSVKHAAIMGRVDLTADVAKQINVVSNTNTAVAGTALTATDIQTAAPTAVATLGAFGSVSLASLLATPDRTFISTKEMVECHYSSKVGADDSLYVMFHVRLFADGRMFVRVVVGNTHFNGSERVQKDYIPTITIDGSTAFDNGGATYLHGEYARYDVTAWIGTDPEIIPRHDTTYLNQTKMIPNYWQHNPDQTTIDYFLSFDSYNPGDHLDYTAIMAATGYQNQIGLLPLWDSLYCTSQADETMYKAVIAHARAIFSYGIATVDTNTLYPATITDHGTWTFSGAFGGGTSGRNTVQQDGSSLVWEKAHFPSAGYLAYLLTADYYYFEAAYYNGIMPYWTETSASGHDFDRLLLSQNRARGWGYRSAAQAAAVVPESLPSYFDEIEAWLKVLFISREADYVTNAVATAWIGYESFYNSRDWPAGNVGASGEQTAGTAPWEHHFTTASVGMAFDIEPVDDVGMASLQAFRDYLYGAPVWILGGNASTDHNFGYAGTYAISIRLSVAPASQWHSIDHGDLIATDAGQIYYDTYNATNPVNNALTGTSGSSPTSSTGYWGNLLPAIAYAVDHGKAGAQDSFNRYLGSDNFTDQSVTADYQSKPLWGIVPRSYSQPAVMFTPVDTLSNTPGHGHTLRVGNLIPNRLVIGMPGHGVLAQDVPSTGKNGPGILFPSLQFPRDTDKEVRVEVVSWPAQGDLFVFPDSSFSYTNAPDGNHSFDVQVYEQGAAVGSPITVNITVSDGSVVYVSLLTNWNLIQTVSKNPQLFWHLQEALNKSTNCDWNMVAEISKSISGDWDAVQGVTRSDQILWNLSQLVQSSEQIQWNAIVSVAQAMDLSWNELTSALSQLDAEWHLITQVQQSTQIEWDMLSSVLQALQSTGLAWDMIQEQVVSRSVDWNLNTSVNTSHDALWDLYNGLSKNIATQWDSTAILEVSKQIVWSMAGPIFKTIQTQWNLLEALNIDRSTAWNLAVELAKQVVAEWTVGQETAGTSIQINWDSVQVTGDTITLNWNLTTEEYVKPMNAIIVLGSDPIIKVMP